MQSEREGCRGRSGARALLLPAIPAQMFFIGDGMTDMRCSVSYSLSQLISLHHLGTREKRSGTKEVVGEGASACERMHYYVFDVDCSTTGRERVKENLPNRAKEIPNDGTFFSRTAPLRRPSPWTCGLTLRGV